ncbi:MAG: Ku protein [Terriglobia bacterium]
MATSVWKGYLTFGLISIPVKLFSAARTERISFNQLHKECMTRVKQPLWCPTHQRIVERSEIVKGYEYEKDQYVIIDEEEIKKIAPPSARTMEILEFVNEADVDPIYFDASYYMEPDDPGRKAYQLLTRTLEETKRVAIAKVAMHQRENIIVVRPLKHGLTLHTLYFADEVRQVSEYASGPEVPVRPDELKLAKQLVESLVAEFDPKKYHDEFQAQLKAMIDAKLQGQQVATVTHPELAPVIDMMEALKKSLAARETAPKKPPARAVDAASEAPQEMAAEAEAAAVAARKARSKRAVR